MKVNSLPLILDIASPVLNSGGYKTNRVGQGATDFKALELAPKHLLKKQGLIHTFFHI